jgi:hypothetical protein
MKTDPQANVVAEALRRFHQPLSEDGHLAARHNGTWSDSLALTHCLCWGAAWTMLDYLVAHPDELKRLVGPQRRELTNFEQQQLATYGPCERCESPRTIYAEVPDPDDEDAVRLSMRCLWNGHPKG